MVSAMRPIGFGKRSVIKRSSLFMGTWVPENTFIHALCEVKGVKDVVGSPTFSIINEYYFPSGKIFHIDLYRLKDEDEAIRAGVEDYLYSDHICFVEWPERAPGLFSPNTVHVFIEVEDSETRHLTIQDK
jgi:tRNA threonylcarbamoyladenosine biosynthesis protein TsaE